MVSTSLILPTPVWIVQKTVSQVAMAVPLWSVYVNVTIISYQEGPTRMNLVVNIIINLH